MKVLLFVFLLIGVCHADTTNSTLDPSTTQEPDPTDVPTTEDPTPDPTTPDPTPTTTSAPEPASSNYFVLYENDVPCIMVTGDLRLTVQYTDTKKASRKSVIEVPVPSVNSSVEVSGVCKRENASYIVLSWSENNFTLTFNLTSPKTWELSDVQLKYKINAKDLPNSPDADLYLHANGTLPGLSHRSVPVNKSLSCRSMVESSAFSGKVAGSNETYKVTATAIGYRFQAFNENPVNGSAVVLQDGLQCYQDDTSDLIPLAVGCALAGLVLIVIVAYLLGRRRRASAYQTVE